MWGFFSIYFFFTSLFLTFFFFHPSSVIFLFFLLVFFKLFSYTHIFLVFAFFFSPICHRNCSVRCIFLTIGFLHSELENRTTLSPPPPPSPPPLPPPLLTLLSYCLSNFTDFTLSFPSFPLLYTLLEYCLLLPWKSLPSASTVIQMSLIILAHDASKM